MGFSLSQKLDKTFRLPQRMAAAFGITDEIFAVAPAQSGTICPAYMYGLILIAFLGWTLGTLLGAAAGQILPKFIIDAMGIVLYGMFLAIIVPVSRKKKSVLAVVALAAACSILFRYVFTAVSSASPLFCVQFWHRYSGRSSFPFRRRNAHEPDSLYCHYGRRDYLIRVVRLRFVKNPEPFSAKLPLLHSLRSAQCHDHSCHFLLHGQRDHSSVGTVVAVLLAYWNLPLIVVALAASAAALVTGFFV